MKSSTGFIQALVAKLESTLPHKTGSSITEVELNAQFIITTNLITKNCKPSEINGDKNFMPIILRGFAALLESLNIDPETGQMLERDTNSLNSTFILIRLLKVIVISNWDTHRAKSKTDDPLFNVGVELNSAFGMSRNCYYLYDRPKPVELDINIDPILKVLFKLSSVEVNRHAFSLLKRTKDPPTHSDYYVSPRSSIEQRHLQSLMVQTDSNIEIIARYLAAANPKDYFSFVKKRLFHSSEQGSAIPLLALQRYAKSLNYFDLSSENIEPYLKLVYTAIPYIRSNTWIQLVLYYQSSCLQIQCNHKPGFYYNVIFANPQVERTCKSLFDIIESAFETSNIASTSLYSWYILACTSDFDDLLKFKKLKQAFNRRLRYLHGMLKDTQAGVNIESFESLLNILLLGSLTPESEGGVRDFSVKYLDETYHNLKKFRQKLTEESLISRHRHLMARFFTAALILNPEIYISHFVKSLKEKHKDYKASPDAEDKIKALQECIETLRALSSQKHYREVFDDIMIQVNPLLFDILDTCARKLSKYETTWSASSSCELDYDTSVVQSLTTLHESSLHETVHSSESQELSESSAVSDERDRRDTHLVSVENVVNSLLHIYTVVPQYFMSVPGADDSEDPEVVVDRMSRYVEKIFPSLDIAIRLRSSDGTSRLFHSACMLSVILLKGTTEQMSAERQCFGIMISDEIIHATCDVLGSLSDSLFKDYYIFLDYFMQEKYRAIMKMGKNKYFDTIRAHSGCKKVNTALDKLFMLSLCTHNIQFFSLLKLSTKLHIIGLSGEYHGADCFNKSSIHIVKAISEDDSVFTGFVSLHKKFKTLLSQAVPTEGLYLAWVSIYERWLEIYQDSAKLSEESTTFKHYTEFLVSTSGCFLSNEANAKIGSQEFTEIIIPAFYDKAVSLLKSSELYIRVVVKDALSSEPHPAVQVLLCEKLTAIVTSYLDMGQVSEEAIHFVEQTIGIFTVLVGFKNVDVFLLAEFFPDFCLTLFSFISLVTNIADQIKLKLRMCKLTSVISADRERLGLSGAHRLRNLFARTAADWLDLASSDKLASAGTRTSDIEYLQVELATDASKCLELQLQSLVLLVPDGTKENNCKQARDLVFNGYFSLFYKIFQKYNSNNPSALVVRSKYKIQSIVDNVLKSISNIHVYNDEVGIEIAFPLGYHENDKIRMIFMEIFAKTYSARKVRSEEEEFPDSIVYQLAEVYELYGAAAETASPSEHNLLASSLHGLFGYTSRLDKLFITLLNDETASVTRTSDIFRSNSTLTRLMSIFAKEYGLPYLTVVLKPFIQEMSDNNVVFEVERGADEADVDLFVEYLQKLVVIIVDSIKWVPDSFRFICTEIYKCIGSKFEEASLIAVGSFLFLRFFCPAIVSPESFFDLTLSNFKVKRSLMQLVKVIQYMANGSLANLRWASLSKRMDAVNDLNLQIFDFIKVIATSDFGSDYPFHRLTLKPNSCLRYVHKFLHTHFLVIRRKFVLKCHLSHEKCLDRRIKIWRQFDKVLADLGSPKPYLSLQGTKSFKTIDPQAIGNSQFAEFMAKMSAKNIEATFDAPVTHNAVFHDGTPVLVVNFRHIRDVGYDINTFVYLVFEAASQIWDNRFYCVYDFTQYQFVGILGKNYVSLMKYYAPKIYFQNCEKAFYFNLSRASHLSLFNTSITLRSQIASATKVYFYSEQDGAEIKNSLCLSEPSLSLNQDVKIVCKQCKIYDPVTQETDDCTIHIGRQWLQIWLPRVKYTGPHHGTETVAPVETFLISELSKCEVSYKSGQDNEFTIHLNKFNYQVTLISPRRQEILRFMYFAMLRPSKQANKINTNHVDDEHEKAQRFCITANLIFHGLLRKNDEVRAASSKLMRSFSSYFDIVFDESIDNLSKVAFPVDTTDYVAAFSSNLARKSPQHTYTFLKAFFDGFDKLPKDMRISGIRYVSPWISNLNELAIENEGSAKVAYIVRQFCKITIANKTSIPIMSHYIWRKLFRDVRLISVIVEELVAMAMENNSESDDWDSIISIFSPSVELCGEIVLRLNDCISRTKKDDSDIALQSKQLEITILVKICASLLFDSYVFASMYLSEVLLFCTLFIDSPELGFGLDLQRLVINTIQSFAQKPNITPAQVKVINDTVSYFSGQRAKMLFGLTVKERGKHNENNQNFDRAFSFELLCDYLHGFISDIGSADDRKCWLSRWSCLAKDIAFSDSLFKKRALTVVSTLARSGISDSTAGRILELLAGPIFDDPETSFEYSVNFYRVEKGLASTSAYLPLLLWSTISFAFSEKTINYQAVVMSMGSNLSRMVLDKNLQAAFFAARKQLEPLFTSVEEVIEVNVNPVNFEFVYLFLFSKGLLLSQCRHISIINIEKVLQVKLKSVLNEVTENEIEAVSEDGFAIAYIMIYYLSVSDSTYQNFLEEQGLDGYAFLQIGEDKLPPIIVKCMKLKCEKMQLAVILASYIFADDCEQSFKWKFIRLYEQSLKNSRESALAVFHIVRPTLEDMLINSSSISLVNDISNLLMSVVQLRYYREEGYQAEIDYLQRKFSFLVLHRVSEFDFGALSIDTEYMRTVRAMFYRILCIVVDGQKLEKY